MFGYPVDNVESISETLLEYLPPIKPLGEPFVYLKLREELQKKKYGIIFSYESTNFFWTWVGATLASME